jgi:gliding-associated putative ABC transporter substrate-binding component GldG
MVNNMSAIWLRFANTIDTVGNPGIEKKPILQTSPYSRTMFHPVRINMQNIRDRMNRRLFNQGPQTVGVLLKGQFNSVFKNRVKPETLETGKYGDLKEKSDSTKMVVISDGDLIRNQYSQLNDQTYELGRDRFTKRTFSNKDFMLNAVDYLLDESGLIQLRAKDFSMRLLNESRAEAEKLYWQIMNMGAPVLIVIIFGILYNFVRKQRFAT